MIDVGHPDSQMKFWNSIAFQKLGAFYYYSPDFTKTRFDAPEMKESLQFFYDVLMNDKSAMPLDEISALQLYRSQNGIKGLYDGRYAMWFNPVFGCNYLDDSYTGGNLPAGTSIGMTNFPKPVGASKPVAVAYTSTASIPANVKDQDAAWALIKFLCLDRADLFAGSKCMHPGYSFKTAAEADAFNDIIFRNHPGFDAEEALEVMKMDRDLVSKDNTIVQGQAGINTLLDAFIIRVFNWEISVDAALAELKTKGDQYIADDLKR
jgi:multiple sugar transport system substrate-binding protein